MILKKEEVKEEYVSEKDFSGDIKNMTTGASGALIIRTESGLRAARSWRSPPGIATN